MSLAACNNYGLRDQLENPGKSANTPGFTALYLFTAGPIQGNVKGSFGSAREGADSLCITARSGYTFTNNSCNQVRAVISLDATDSISNMPMNYGVPTNRSINAPNNFVIAPDWNALRDGTSGTSLAPNVMPAATAWWSFSITGGNFYGSYSCSGGTSNGGPPTYGMVGNSSDTGANWIGSGQLACNMSNLILCICY
jgi:hypothetical protein